MRAASVINGLPPEQLGLDPLSNVTTELMEDLRKLQAMGLDLSELVQPKLSKAEQAKVNGAKSKGPVTEAGKATSSQNALKHGLCARALLLPGEDPAAFETFVADFDKELSPRGMLQATLVQRAAELAWKLRRLPAVEGAILESARVTQAYAEDDDENASQHTAGGMGDVMHQLIGKNDDGILLRLQRYETRLERSLQGCLRELRLVKKDALDAGSFGSGAVRSNGDLVGRALPAEESVGQKAAPIPQGVSGGQCPPYKCAVGSFGKTAVGSFGKNVPAAVRMAANAAATSCQAGFASTKIAGR